MEENLSNFGETLIKEVRDETMIEFEKIVGGLLKGETAQKLYAQISKMPLDNQEVLKKVVKRMVDLTIHNMLCLFEDSEDGWTISNPSLDVENLSELSDGLSGELYSGDGWISKYSKFS